MNESSPKGDKGGGQMRFYTKQHSHYCGIDLHTRTMYLCILNQAGAIVLHRNMRADPDSFLKAIAPFGQDIVVAVECIFRIGLAAGALVEPLGIAFIVSKQRLPANWSVEIALS